MQPNHALARVDFLRWVKNYSPDVYSAVVERDGLGVADAAVVPATGFWANLTATFKDVMPTLTQTYAQRKIFKAQMKRAERGLPPLKTAEYAPTVRVQADIAPSTRNAIFSEIKGGVSSMIMPLALVGLLGALLYTMSGKRK